jgi:hypothetical protein
MMSVRVSGKLVRESLHLPPFTVMPSATKCDAGYLLSRPRTHPRRSLMAVPLAVACYLKAHILCTVRECECACHRKREAA